MSEAIHSSYEMRDDLSVFSRISRSLGYAANLGMGLVKAAAEGMPDLLDPNTSILRRHPMIEVPPPVIQPNLN